MSQYLIASFEQMLKKDPKSRVFLRLAEELRKSDQFEKAIGVCQKGIQHHPGYLPALVCLGRCHESLEQYEEAEQTFRTVLQRAPDNPHALRGLANILFEMGKHAEALDFFESLAIQEPNDEEIQEKIHLIHQKLIDPGMDHTPGAVDTLGNEDLAEPDELEPLPEEASADDGLPSGLVTESPDEIDLRFQRAINEVDESALELFDDLEELAEDDPPEVEVQDFETAHPGEPPTAAPPASADEAPLAEVPAGVEPTDNFSAGEPPAETPVQNAQAGRETRKQKKIRLLNDLLEQIKGATHV